jgi:hypothetical protein
MKIENIKEGLPVVYVLNYLHGKEIKDDQLGIVSSVNDTYAFVKYKTSQSTQATNPEDLFPIHNRPDLIERLGLEVKPVNRVCELWIEEKKRIADLKPKNHSELF